MTCEKCIHKLVCAARRKLVDAVFQETAILETKDLTGIFSAAAEICTKYKAIEHDDLGKWVND